ncbi:MAG: hypothetical protein V4616_02305 [Bacteroidota bacterium]
MTNVKVNPLRRERIEKRFILHIVLTFLLLYPILARFAAGDVIRFFRFLPFQLAMFFLEYPTLSGLLFGCLSIYAMVLGTLSMEIHSVNRKLVTFPLFLFNLLCVLMYFASAV